MAGGPTDEVIAPDQLKPTNRRTVRVGGIVVILILLSLLIGNHQGAIEDLWVIGTAAAIALMLIGEWLLKKNGLRND